MTITVELWDMTSIERGVLERLAEEPGSVHAYGKVVPLESSVEVSKRVNWMIRWGIILMERVEAGEPAFLSISGFGRRVLEELRVADKRAGNVEEQ